MVGGESIMDQIFRAIAAFQKMVDDGLIVTEFPDLHTKVSGLEPNKVPWPFPLPIARLPERERILPKLSGEPRQALEACYKMLAGVRLTEPECSRVARLAKFGTGLTWSTQPPKGAFEMLKKNLEKPQPRR